MSTVSRENKLLEEMELCGHFLYHRRGGKRGQRRILRILCEENVVSQKDLQKILDIQSGSLSEITIKLETNGLITRSKDEEDKRNILLAITDAGKREYERLLQVNKQQEKLIFTALTKEEQEQLSYLLGKLLTDWKINFADILETHRKGGRNGKVS